MAYELTEGDKLTIRQAHLQNGPRTMAPAQMEVFGVWDVSKLAARGADDKRKRAAPNPTMRNHSGGVLRVMRPAEFAVYLEAYRAETMHGPAYVGD
jgi:hypothetical protein